MYNALLDHDNDIMISVLYTICYRLIETKEWQYVLDKHEINRGDFRYLQSRN